MQTHTPIAAQATPHGRGGVSIIRISGPEILPLVNPLIRPNLDPRHPNKMFFGSFHTQDGSTLDECLFVYFEGPKSFTGEDLIEIHCHGSPFVCQKILSVLYSSGMRPAEPGEFTRRAYENGKISLIKAESIASMVDAESADQWNIAREMSNGILSSELVSVKAEILAILAQIESRIEFPDEGDIEELLQSEILKQIDRFSDRLLGLIETYQSGRVAHVGLSVALIGPPNAGKSTLLNILTRSERSIVTDIAGTTRDFIEESTLIKGHLFQFVDTAGIRNATDPIEEQGISRSKQKATAADLVLLLIPADTSAQKMESFWQEMPIDAREKCWLVVTKNDLKPLNGADMTEWLNKRKIKIINISAYDPSSLQKLEENLVVFCRQLIDRPTKAATRISLARHRHVISNALESISQSRKEALSSMNHLDLVAFELSQAARFLDELVGAVSTEEVLDEIFSNFCVGK